MTTPPVDLADFVPRPHTTHYHGCDCIMARLKAAEEVARAAEAAVANDDEWERWNLGSDLVPEADKIHTERMRKALQRWQELAK